MHVSPFSIKSSQIHFLFASDRAAASSAICFSHQGDFWLFFGRFSIYLAASAAKYCGKGLAAMWKSFGKVLEKLNFQAVIKSAASASSLDLQGSQRTTARLADDGYG